MPTEFFLAGSQPEQKHPTETISPPKHTGERICVIGGSGNIGGSVSSALLERGYEVTSVVRGSKMPASSDIRTILCDRSDRETFENLMRNEKFDAAIDLACFTPNDAKSSVNAFREVGRFVQTSTVCTYGPDTQWLPVTEDHPLRPNIPYGEQKAAADTYFLTMYEKEGFPVTILKPSTSYGPQQGLFPQVGKDFSWIDRIRSGKPIIVCDSGMALHQFMHVDDVAQAYVAALDTPQAIGQTYNVVNGVTTWAQFHRAAMLVIGKEVEMVSIPFSILKQNQATIPGFELLEDVFQYHSFYSGDKIKQDMPQFQPKISLEAGIEMVLQTLDASGRIPKLTSRNWEDDLLDLVR